MKITLKINFYFLLGGEKYAHPPARPPTQLVQQVSYKKVQFKIQIRQGKRETLKPKGLLGSFFKELSFGG